MRGLLDERFFLYFEAPDLCRRIKQAGWSVRHVPFITIVQHAGKGGRPPRRRPGCFLALQTLLGMAEPPFARPPRTAIPAGLDRKVT